MAPTVEQFWKLVAQAQLVGAKQQDTLRTEFLAHHGPASTTSARHLAQWLVKQRVLTSYQATVLLNGKAGPFQYDDYRILRPRPVDGPGVRRFEGLHVSTQHRLLLTFHLAQGPVNWAEVASMFADARRWRHPHLDRHYALVERPQHRYVVSEWPEGSTLETILQQRGRINVTQACHIAFQVADALSYLHTLGHIHGGVCPREVVVQSSGHVKLLQQPLLTLLPRELPDWKVDGPYSATHGWAPEFLLGTQLPDELTDIYSLGCLLYTMIKGTPPFQDETLEDLLRAHATQRIEPLETMTQVPTGLTETVAFMMAKKRNLRYQTIGEVLEKLEAFVPAGVRQSAPRGRPTESFYLAHLERQGSARPQHLEDPRGDRSDEEQRDRRPTVYPVVPSPARPPEQSVGEPTAAATNLDRPSGPESIEIRVATDSSPVSTLTKRRSSPRWFRGRTVQIAAGAAITLVVTLLVLVPPWKVRSPDSTDVPSRIGIADAKASSGDPGKDVASSFSADTSDEKELIADDGITLWASPTAGEPMDLRYVPAGAAFFVETRPSALTSQPEASAALRALGPGFKQWVERFESLLQFSFADIERLLISLVPTTTSWPEVVYTMEVTPAQREQLLARMEDRSERIGDISGRLGSSKIWLPADDPSLAIVGSPSEVDAMLNADGRPPLRRQLEQLRLATDRQRDLNVLFSPNFLAADGQVLLSGTLAPIRSQIMQFLGERTQAALLSAHLQDLTYLEFRWSTDVEEQPFAVATERRQALQQLPERVNEYLGGIAIDPYWQPLAIRYPLMITWLSQQTRIGVEDDCAVVNAVLPPQAAHNLLLATELALASQPLRQVLPASEMPDSGTLAAPMSIDQLLNRMTDFVVEQQSLEGVMAEFQESVRTALAADDFQIRIQGQDLQLDGITRNQQIRNVDLRDRSVRAILSELVSRANPVATESLTLPEQKLVWVVAPPDLGLGERAILITTRNAAGQKGYELPEEFVAGSATQTLE